MSNDSMSALDRQTIQRFLVLMDEYWKLLAKGKSASKQELLVAKLKCQTYYANNDDVMDKHLDSKQIRAIVYG